MRVEYEGYLKRWLDGLQDEIFFWEEYMANEGGDYFRTFDWNVEPNKTFELEDELTGFSKEQFVRFLDVGSGPFSRCGCMTDMVDLNVTAVDPLAGIYNDLKKQYGLENGITISTGFLELLHRSFEENSFDIVHMSNSMDHAFDPILGLYELLYICKIGGKVILRHAENEAENANYGGLHQWNLSTHRKKGCFVIWNKEREININEKFNEYADIIIENDIIENTNGQWIYNKVTFVKKRDILLPENNYYDEMLWKIYGYLLNALRNNNRELLGKTDKKHEKRIKVQKALRKIKHNPNIYGTKFKEMFPEGVCIYGFGNVGKELFDVCKLCEVKVNKTIDKQKIVYRGVESVSIDEYISSEEIKVIVSLVESFSEIKNEMIKKGLSSIDIISIDKVTDEIMGLEMDY